MMVMRGTSTVAGKLVVVELWLTDQAADCSKEADRFKRAVTLRQIKGKCEATIGKAGESFVVKWRDLEITMVADGEGWLESSGAPTMKALREQTAELLRLLGSKQG